MKLKLAITLIGVLLCTGCYINKSNFRPVSWKQTIDIPASQIVFQTIINDPDDDNRMHDVVGFYNLVTGEITKIDLDLWLMTPIYLNSDTIIAINKLGNPGDVGGFSGYIFIFSENSYLACDAPEATGWWILPYKGNILIDSDYGINLINSKDCSVIRTVLLHDQFARSKGKFIIGPYSLSSNGNFIIVESDKRLFNINLTNMEVFDYHKAGSYPTISPDQKRIIYSSLDDGIHIMDIDGTNDRLIVKFESNTYDPYELERGIPPRPRWSVDGTKLTYHKCTASGIAHGCTDIIDYSIYIYDFNSQTETWLFNGGLNPSWR
jgi:hypothetical protein